MVDETLLTDRAWNVWLSWDREYRNEKLGILVYDFDLSRWGVFPRMEDYDRREMLHVNSKDACEALYRLYMG